MMDTNEPMVTFSLVRYRKPGLRTLAYLGLDRWKMHRAPGVHFWCLVGWVVVEFPARFRPLWTTGTWDGTNYLALFNMLTS